MGGIPIDVSALVGRTPMVRLGRMAPDHVELYGKLEAGNPGGSVKDRIGVAMIEDRRARGRIEPGRTTVVEATSGNTGSRWPSSAPPRATTSSSRCRRA
jgi:cysteine synthase A